MRATEHQRLAADPALSAWVTASAGTGKTHVLTDRVLRLLLMDCPPERILCLTFTKAAAAEMANRLHDRLGQWAVASDEGLRQDLVDLTGLDYHDQTLDLARRLFARVLDAPGGLKVQTIHSFCEALLRRFPLEARIAPHFQVMDERQAAGVLGAALQTVLEQDAETPEPLVASLMALVDPETFGGLMTALSADRGRLQRLLDRPGGLDGPDGLLAQVRWTLGLADDEDEDSILRMACAEESFPGAALYELAEAMRAGGKIECRHGQAIADWLEVPDKRPAQFDAYLAGYFTEGGRGNPYAKPLTKQTMADHPGGLALIEAETARLGAVRQRRNAARVGAATGMLLALGARLIAAYGAEKQRLALLDYDDLVLRAGALLSGGTSTQWVMYKLDGGLEHILIDEAQDTNPEQWQVVATLADEFFTGEGAFEDGDDSLLASGRTLFAVGDVKQSIYSFQRADPAAFQAMRQHFAARVGAAKRRWQPVGLALSFRSTPAVLRAVDAIFAAPDARDGLLFDAGDDDVRHIPNRATDGGLVEIWPTEQPQEVEQQPPWAPPIKQQYQHTPVARLAGRIADRIEQWLSGGEMLEAKGRAVGPGDILILVQRRAGFVEAMVRALKRKGIAVAGVDRMVLMEQLAVMDLVALGHFLLLPEDDLNLAIVLKGPLVGWDDGQLFDLAHGRSGTLWAALRRRPDSAARQFLADLLGRVDFAPPFELYAELLGAGGGRRAILSRLGPDANDPINEFLDLALSYERDHPPSLQGFLHWLERSKTEVKRDLDQGRNEVRVMTVHGAKGLEAPIVFLADTVRVPERTPALLWPETGSDDSAPPTVPKLTPRSTSQKTPLWAPIRAMEEEIMAQARGLAEAERDREYRRLFYVALTRAADRLYICGFEGKAGRKDHCWYDMAWRALAAMPEIEEPAELPGGLRLRNEQGAAPPPTAAATELEAAPLPSWARQSAPVEPVPPRPLVPSRPGVPEPGPASPLADDGHARFRRGNHIHRLLQTLPDLPAHQRRDAAARYLALPAHVLEPAQQAEILAETLAVLKHLDFAILFGPGSRSEVPLTGLIAGRVISGVVDRLAVTDSEVLIVDYKSNRPPPRRPGDVDGSYLRQLASYRAALRDIYPEKTVRCALLWTDGPRLMAIGDDQLNAHAP